MPQNGFYHNVKKVYKYKRTCKDTVLRFLNKAQVQELEMDRVRQKEMGGPRKVQILFEI